LIDQFYKPETIDCYTFVFDEMDPSGYNTTLAMSEDGYQFSQWTSGLYDLEGPNEHLGRHVDFHTLGARVMDAFFARLSIPQEWEEAHDVIEQIIREDREDGDA
jgi:hypothetical protein